MRFRGDGSRRSSAVVSMLAFAAGVAGAGCDTAPPCDIPAGCVRAERVDGACACSEWAIVEEREIPLKYVVVSVVYPMAGNASAVQYGGIGEEPFYAVEYAPVAVRLRVRVRSRAGVESVVPVRRVDDGGGAWTLRVATPASVLASAPRAEPLIHASVADVSPNERDDRILVWVNPRAVLATDAAGGKSVAWEGTGSTPAECGPEPLHVVSVAPAQVAGTAATDDPCAAAFLATLSGIERAEIRRHDGFLEPPGRLPDGFFADARFQTLENTWPVYRDDTYTVSQVEMVSWSLVEPPSDVDEALLRTERGLASGETVVLEHVPVADPAAPTRTLGYAAETLTIGCEVTTGVVVDLAFGTAAMMVSADWPLDYPPAACTRS